MATAQEIVVAEYRNRMAAAKRTQKTRSMEHVMVRKSSGILSAALYGTLNRMAVPHTIGGFPWKLGVIAVAQLGEGLSKGNMQAAMAGLADATTAIYIERSITTATIVAGEGGEV